MSRLFRLPFLAASLAATVVLSGPLAAQQPLPTDPPPGTPASPTSVVAMEPRSRLFFRFGLEGGGEKVLEFRYEDGSSPDVTAGGGLLLQAGGMYSVFERNAHRVELQGSVGLKWRTIPEASNQSANWLRFPVEALVMYNAPGWFRGGAGMTTHLANKLTTSGEVANGSLEFATTPGAVIQAEYLRNQFGVDLRYTILTYEVSGTGTEVDANSLGVGFTFWFGGQRGR